MAREELRKEAGQRVLITQLDARVERLPEEERKAYGPRRLRAVGRIVRLKHGRFATNVVVHHYDDKQEATYLYHEVLPI